MAERHITHITPKQEAAYWSRVRKGGPDECWVWTAARRGIGYGVGYAGSGQQTATHIALFGDYILDKAHEGGRVWV